MNIRNSIYLTDEKLLNSDKGTLFIAGGGLRHNYMMEAFIQLAGGKDARLILIPSASQNPLRCVSSYIEQFTQLGCSNINYIDSLNPDINNKKNLDLIEKSNGLFFTGGDQNKLVEVLKGSELLSKIIDRYKSGGVIGGTSAGAAVMSRIMMTSFLEKEEILSGIYPPEMGSYALAEGFGFLDSVIIDQHFSQRKRHGRLLDAVLQHKGHIGIGIDESTAIIVNPDGRIRVIGEGTVTCYSDLPISSTLLNLTGQNVSVLVLVSGDSLNLHDFFPA